MSKIIDITGKKYGKLTVISYFGKKKWLCKCDCGNECIVLGYSLKIGNTKSCGCYRKELNTKHNLSRSRIYRIYNKMKRRCYSVKDERYISYGGRGIKVCDEWLNDKKKFFEWAINNGYKDTLTIDRIDNNKGYCPENCRWITNKDQQRNKTNNIIITYKSYSKCYSEWAELLKVDRSGFRKGFLRNGITYLERKLKEKGVLL